MRTGIMGQKYSEYSIIEKSDTGNVCSLCGSDTQFVDVLAMHMPCCSEACSERFWREFAEACSANPTYEEADDFAQTLQWREREEKVCWQEEGF
jgi:hypothetical protein